VRYKVLNSDGKLDSFLKLTRQVREEWSDGDAKCVGEEEPPWYRGQGDASWGLIPKIYRPEFANADEKELRHEFQSAGSQLLGSSTPKDRWDWYFLMQHYGAPTRLWSARLEMCQWIRETLDKESIWDEARSTGLSR
jgi:hypothetical protein